MLHSRRAHGGKLPEGVEEAKDFASIAEQARLIVLAVPSEVLQSVAEQLGNVVDGRHLMVHGIRGLGHGRPGDGDDGHALEPLSDVLRRETPARRMGALGGPVLAEDMFANRPSVLVCGSSFPEVNDAVTAAFGSPTLRVYATTDLRGVEWASALVGCLAIAVGYAKASGLNAGLVAALISRGVEEAARIAHAAGGEERTLLGLAGYGDLLASIAQDERPEVVVGRELARGKSIEQALVSAKLRVEAVQLIPRISRWCHDRGVQAPIFHAIANGVLRSSSPEQIVHELMTTPLQKLA
ncbi:MAG: Glycerol-3-phosphate dehydrogenase [Myxococcaceae bacterium]|jgi:glycerol-3-phosphate dehydrogenase (NAD(P)+)|nr:Glycerol-3-phosphate dehydrogenase [Myxococcaceae bacterium]